MLRTARLALVVLVCLAVALAFGGRARTHPLAAELASAPPALDSQLRAEHRARAAAAAGRPQVVDVYAETRRGDEAPAVAALPARVYVPNTLDNTVTVIDPAT